jgi:hypothetical protein
MHVYEIYAAVGAHLGGARLGDARLQGPAYPWICMRYMGILAYYTGRSGHLGLGCQSILELRSEEQEIC